MSEPKWIPGPWRLEGDRVRADDGRPDIPWNVCEFRVCGGLPGEIQKANAQLIASAPELFEALTALLNEVIEAGFETATDYGWPNAISNARAALAKARGEP